MFRPKSELKVDLDLKDLDLDPEAQSPMSRSPSPFLEVSSNPLYSNPLSFKHEFDSGRPNSPSNFGTLNLPRPRGVSEGKITVLSTNPLIGNEHAELMEDIDNMELYPDNQKEIKFLNQKLEQLKRKEDADLYKKREKSISNYYKNYQQSKRVPFPDSEQFYKETDEDLNPPQIWPLGLTRRNTTRKSGGKYRRRKMNKMARKSKKNKKSKKHVGRKSK